MAFSACVFIKCGSPLYVCGSHAAALVHHSQVLAAAALTSIAGPLVKFYGKLLVLCDAIAAAVHGSQIAAGCEAASVTRRLVKFGSSPCVFRHTNPVLV